MRLKTGGVAVILQIKMRVIASEIATCMLLINELKQITITIYA
jgi:hypothetical protein